MKKERNLSAANWVRKTVPRPSSGASLPMRGGCETGSIDPAPEQREPVRVLGHWRCVTSYVDWAGYCVFQPEPSGFLADCVGKLSQEGWECAQVPTGGPNDGLWYVSNASWSVHRRSGINPALLETHDYIPVTSEIACTSGGSGTWVAYNVDCGKQPDAAAFVAGAQAHEDGHVNQGTTAMVW